MKTTIKGSLAALAAATLLLGGAGSLAFWQDSQIVSGSNITSGELKLGVPACGGWKLDGNVSFDPAVQKIVPGDTLTKVCDINLIATGDHLGATLGLTSSAFTDAATNKLAKELTTSAVFTVNGTTTTTITEADDTGPNEIKATVSVNFPGGPATNDSQATTAVLNAITLSATQTHTP